MSTNNYTSVEELESMTPAQKISKLQEIIFEYKEHLKQGDFKTSQDILKCLYDTNQKEEIKEEAKREEEDLEATLLREEKKESQVFFSELEKYRVSFNLLTPYPDIALPEGDGCESCHLGNTSFEKSRIHVVFYLHPVLVDFLHECDNTDVIDDASIKDMKFWDDNTERIIAGPPNHTYIPERIQIDPLKFCHRLKRRGLSYLICKQYKNTIGSVLSNHRIAFKGTVFNGCPENGNTTSREYAYYSKITLHSLRHCGVLN